MYRYQEEGVTIVEVPVKEFKITMVNAPKKGTGKKDISNAGFFGVFHEENGKVGFTLPVGHLRCDYEVDPKISKSNSYCNNYCHERGSFSGDKFTFDSYDFTYMNQFYHKSVSTLSIVGDKAQIDERAHPIPRATYCIAGVPVMRHGEDVKFNGFVTGQGWDSSTLYATYHIFLATKNAHDDTVYVLGYRTRTGNYILSAEMFKILKKLGFYDCIALDGGGSYYLNADGKTEATSENRRINTIIEFGTAELPITQNPYSEPTKPITKGCTNKEWVKWLQWELWYVGYYSMSIDGSFGPGTDAALRKYQSDHRLEVDGWCGPVTCASLKANHY